eukprot:6193847-Pleurochrysis_carterae.AAC.1
MVPLEALEETPRQCFMQGLRVSCYRRLPRLALEGLLNCTTPDETLVLRHSAWISAGRGNGSVGALEDSERGRGRAGARDSLELSAHHSGGTRTQGREQPSKKPCPPPPSAPSHPPRVALLDLTLRALAPYLHCPDGAKGSEEMLENAAPDKIWPSVVLPAVRWIYGWVDLQLQVACRDAV